MGIKDDLKRAIEARNTISFDYKGHRRIVEPYHYGIPVMTAQDRMIKKQQEASLLCYQIGGGSNSNLKTGKPITFRTIPFSGINNLKINENETFNIRDDYDSADRKWSIEYGVANLQVYKP
jgi:hypothetical protein